MKKYLLLSLAILINYSLFAQSHLDPCATPAEKVDWLTEYQKSPDSYFKNGNEVIFVPLTIHIVGSDNGLGYFSLSRTFNAICELNEDFAESNIYFFVEGDFNYIDNSTYYDHTFEEGYQMMLENNVANTMNCYFVDNPAGACGYSYYGVGVAMAKSCTKPGDNTFAHELGHAFSLPHTFFGWEGTEGDYANKAPEALDNGHPVEKTDGSNCGEAADGFCDTPPDYLNYRWQCNSSGLSSLGQHDPDSVRFQSDGTFYMSYSNDACSARFSEEQIGAMRANLMEERTNFLYNQEFPGRVGATELDAISPLEGDTIPANQVVLDWEDINNATHYFVQIGRTANFAVVVESAFVEASEYRMPTALSPNKTHYWRVQPYNSHSFCASPLFGAKFRTGDINTTSVSDLSSTMDIKVQPTLVSDNAPLNLTVDSPNNLSLAVSVFNITGQKLQTETKRIIAGKNQFDLATDNLESGIYFLHLYSSEGQKVIKFIKE